MDDAILVPSLALARPNPASNFKIESAIRRELLDCDRYSSMAAKKREDRERFSYQDLVEITSFGESIL